MTLRFFVWNCNAALHKKVKPIQALEPDIAVISDCANPDAVLRQAPEFKFTDAVWIGHSKNRGLGVFSFGEHLTAASTAYDPTYDLFLPVIIMGRHNLNVLAVWTRHPANRHRGRVHGNSPRSALRHYRHFIGQDPTMVAGDLNGAAVGAGPRRTHGFFQLYDELVDNGWVSVWCPDGKSTGGEKPAPTACRRNNFKRSYRVDCCLIPRGWLPGLQSATVCQTAVWARLSHHLPLVVDLVPVV